MTRIRSILVLLLSGALLAAAPQPGEPHATADAVTQEIEKGIGRIGVALAKGDWTTVHAEAEAIHSSYVMAQALTHEQREALHAGLPDGFKRLDARFHGTAKKLSEAAVARDADIAIHHYARLIEGCAECHARYAEQRFPGFQPPAPQADH
jgi:cytochrome c556